MPSELPLINELFNIKVRFEKLSLLIHQNSKRESIFYTSKAEIERNDFCREKVKPLLNELQVYFDDFQNLFQRDIKEMKDAFKQNDVYLDEIENQNDLLKDQLLEASLTEDIKNLVITSCVEIRNKDLHDEYNTLHVPEYNEAATEYNEAATVLPKFTVRHQSISMLVAASTGSLCPSEGDPPKFLQLYVYDTDKEADNRMQHFGGDNSDLRRDIVEGLIELLDNHSALVNLGADLMKQSDSNPMKNVVAQSDAQSDGFLAVKNRRQHNKEHDKSTRFKPKSTFVYYLISKKQESMKNNGASTSKSNNSNNGASTTCNKGHGI
ncbi:hypothetical protein Tco_0908023 [Tanacetum coccineum]|uniref:Uncharacterized protein n=1 Tax=Tanacetum coccineum TaxID=301880 RepID=A0ABQ5CP74_9ASTR